MKKTARFAKALQDAPPGSVKLVRARFILSLSLLAFLACLSYVCLSISEATTDIERAREIDTDQIDSQTRDQQWEDSVFCLL
jgi:hypothetical protein